MGFNDLQIRNNEEIDSEIDKIFSDRFSYENRDIVHDVKLYLRIFKRRVRNYIRERVSKRFTNILYVTTDCPEYTLNSIRLDSPVYYMEEMRKSYPNNEIRLFTPIVGLELDSKPTRKIFLEFDGIHKVLERTSIHFNYFSKNEEQTCVIYEFLNTDSNIKIYGLYSPAFSYLKTPEELLKFENLVMYMRTVRYAVRKIHKKIFPVDIIHCEKVPFFAGAEFEPKIPAGIKVLQTVDDFAFQDTEKRESFWALINIADKKAMKKICRDGYIRTCLSDLFNIHPAQFSGKIKDYLDIIYKNYMSFKMFANAEGKNKSEIIFYNLNLRILKMFPQVFAKDDSNYYPMYSSVKNADYCAVYSKTYYKNMSENKNMPDLLVELVKKYKDKFLYVMPAFDKSKYVSDKGRLVYNNFSSEDFRENRKENKIVLIKEFSRDRINTKFIDKTLFKEEDANITGYLDNFYDAPLMFYHVKPDVFGYGIDILFETLFKLFEVNRNIKIIICIPNGLKYTYIKSRIDFMQNMQAFNGRWVFINNEINLTKFFAGADLFMLPQRENYINFEHIIGMKYGCVPVVSNTGYLNDTVIDLFDDITNCSGFKIKESIWDKDCAEQFYSVLTKALDIYENNPSGWNAIMKNCLNNEAYDKFEIFERYNNIYEELL